MARRLPSHSKIEIRTDQEIEGVRKRVRGVFFQSNPGRLYAVWL